MQAVTTGARRAPAHAVSSFLFGAKESSTGEDSRGIRQRFPYWCNKTKTSRTAGRRSPWSPRRRHHQSLWQTKTTFVRITCTSCLPSNLAVVGSLPAQYLGRGLGPLYIGLATTICEGGPHLGPDPFYQGNHTSSPSTRTPLLKRLFFPCNCSSSSQGAIHHTTME